MVAFTCSPSSWEAEVGELSVESHLRLHVETKSQQKSKYINFWRHSSVIEQLSSMCSVLSSIPSTILPPKKNKNPLSMYGMPRIQSPAIRRSGTSHCKHLKYCHSSFHTLLRVHIASLLFVQFLRCLPFLLSFPAQGGLLTNSVCQAPSLLELGAISTLPLGVRCLTQVLSCLYVALELSGHWLQLTMYNLKLF